MAGELEMRTRTLLATIITGGVLLLAGCGGEENAFGPPAGGGGGDGGGPGGPVALFGTGTGADFIEGSIGIGVSPLSAGGNSGLSVSLIEPDGALFTQEATISFSSSCIAQGLATVTGPVTTTTGIANANYVARGCDGDDIITATANIDGEPPMTASGTINVLPAVLGSVEFVSAEPATIALRGMGGFGNSETATVVFTVRDTTGGIVVGQEVAFTLSTTVGGITLAPTVGTTNSSGQVSTVVQAGNVPTPVRVRASISGTSPLISTQSDLLTISTGIADEDSMSISVDVMNPEGWDLDGITTEFTIRAADRFNNPVPDGTAISVVTEGGVIQPSCSTTDGACSVTWTSQSPRPADGRSGVMAYALGEETFADVNGNGVFDDGDTFDDVGEPFIDENENGVYDAGERFIDSNSDGAWDPPDGRWNGALCQHSTLCGPSGELIHVAARHLIVLSGSTPVVTTNPAALDLNTDTALTVFVEDVNGQVPPFGTTVEVTTSVGEVVNDIETMPSTNAPGPYVFQFFFTPGATGDTGTAIVTVTTPSGRFTRVSVPVTDTPP